jgi:hypothetical protein
VRYSTFCGDFAFSSIGVKDSCFYFVYTDVLRV